MLDLGGIFPPLPTSFNQDEDLLVAKMQDNIRLLNEYKLRGYLVLGSNGELIHLDEAEKEAVYQATREVIPADKLMLAGTGAQTTRETIRLSRAAAKAGADAVLVLNPSYYRGLMTREALVKHYHEIADALAIPVIIYNMPANSGIDMEADVILAIAKHDNIIGLKDSGGNLTKMASILENTDTDFQVLAGSAGFLLPALSIGAKGGILALANIMPQHCLDLHDQFMQGNYAQAAQIQKAIVHLNGLVTRGWGVPALKAAMDHLGLYGGPSRKPILPLAPDKTQTLIEAIVKAQSLSPIVP